MKYSTKTFVLVFVAAVTIGTPCIAQHESHSDWKRLPDMAVPRWEAGTVVLDNKLYVFGGYRMPTKSCKRVDVFDPKDNSWRKLADLPSAISHMNPVLDGRTVWFAGGFKDGYKGYAISEVLRYDIDKDTYTAGPSLPQSLSAAAAGILDGKLYLAGGSPNGATPQPGMWVRSAP